MPAVHSGVKILVVDDEPMIANTISLLLRRMGYDADGETNPVQALERVRTTPHGVDVLLTDQMMPEMTGDALAQAVRRVRPDLPVLIMTGFSYVASPERVAELGVAAVLQKPLAPDQLRAAITLALVRAGPGSWEDEKTRRREDEKTRGREDERTTGRED